MAALGWLELGNADEALAELERIEPGLQSEPAAQAARLECLMAGKQWDEAAPLAELLDGTTALWQALIDGDEERAYRIYFPICALCTLQLQGGLDGFIVVERYLMHKRGLFPNQVHRGPLSYFLDPETCAEINRLYDLLQEALQ